MLRIMRNNEQVSFSEAGRLPILGQLKKMETIFLTQGCMN